MATPSTSLEQTPTGTYARTLALITLGVVLARLAVVWLTPLDLFYDEAQYWFWGQNLAFGYFSKPPLVAFLIAASTAICGDSEACIRSAAPLFHGVTTMLVFGLGTALYGARVGFFSGLAYLVAIAVSASSLLISTDVPLLLCWVGGLWAFARYVEMPSLKLALLFGLAIAVGLNAKYAMIYFPLCALIFLGATKSVRPLLARVDFWIGIGVGLLGFIPNLIWNIQNDFITFSHTGENISGDGFSLNPLSFLEFVGTQFGIVGPIIFAAYGVILFKGWRSATPTRDRMLIAFSAPILIILGLQAFQSSANYNWAATAFPALTVFTTAVLMELQHQRWVRWNLISCAVVAALLAGASLAVLALKPTDPIIASTNLEDMYGWAEHAELMGQELDKIEPDTLVFVGRRYAAGFAYYLRDRPERMTAYHTPGAAIRNHFELTAPWHAPAPGNRAVIISPANVSPNPNGRLIAVVEGSAPDRAFRSNSYMFLVEGPAD